MTFSSCLIDQSSPLVLDASIVINLLATGHSRVILGALGVPLFVTGNVTREIKHGAASGRTEYELLSALINERLLQVEELAGECLSVFFDLVSGNASDTLGDGEAATIAFAFHHSFSAAIDEKKATRIVQQRLGMLPLVTTVDVLAFAPVQTALGTARLGEATFNALRRARMQVREHQFSWVLQQVGRSNVDACPSLRRHARRLSELA